VHMERLGRHETLDDADREADSKGQPEGPAPGLEVEHPRFLIFGRLGHASGSAPKDLRAAHARARHC
jgi:hypothetical protein